MLFRLNIEKTLRSKKRYFHLKSRFTTGDDAVVLFGPSGSGKSLTLRAIAGLLTPDRGRIEVDGDVLFDSAAGVNLPARKRRVGFVFQNYALFPHLTVRGNVGFGLTGPLRRLSKNQRGRVDELLDLCGLAEVADCHPEDISGGQQQRAAVARALALEPRILLLDEPFSALDQPLKRHMRRELQRVLSRFSIPLVLVTHDPAEVEAFAKTVVVYNEGLAENALTSAEAGAQGAAIADLARERLEAACLQ